MSAAERLVPVLTRYSKVIAVIIAVIAAIAGFQLRMTAVYKYGYYLNAYDPWIVYWITKQLYDHGLGYWWHLTREVTRNLFWYPWGRDFPRTEYPLMPALIALTYPLGKSLGFTLMQWCVIFPPILGALIVIGSFLAVREATGSDAAGVTAALLVAFLPACMDRTIAGFLEKEGMATAIMAFVFFAYLRGLHKRDLKWFIAAGVLLAAIFWTWGGCYYVLGLVAAHLALLPILNYDVEKDTVIGATAMFIALDALSFFNPKVKPITPLFIEAGAIALLLIYLYGCRRFAEKLKLPFARTWQDKAMYIGVLVVAAAAFLVLAYFNIIPIGTRYLAAIFPWLRTRNIIFESVAEHQPPSLTAIWHELGAVLILAAGAVLYAIYKRSPGTALLALGYVIAIYVLTGRSYFMQLAGFHSALCAAVLAAPAASMIRGHLEALSVAPSKARIKRKKVTARREEMGGLLFGATLAAVIVLTVAFTVWSGAAYAARMPPQSILTAGTGVMMSNAWLEAMKFMNTTLPSDAVVIAWWDYGYWISVGGNRASVADGATINGTQMRLLAKALTGTEEEAARIFVYNFHCKPNKTFVLVYDVFVLDNSSRTAWPILVMIGKTPQGFPVISEGTVDIPKSKWMLAIAGKNVSEYINFTGPIMIGLGEGMIFYGPLWTEEKVQNALVYRIMIDGIYELGYKFVAPYDGAVPRPNMTYFKPYKIIVDKKEVPGRPGSYRAVVIFIYELLRAPSVG